MLPKEGNHSAKLNGQIVIYEAPSGALCAAIPVKLTTDVSWNGKSTQTLVKSDGTPNTRTYDDMKSIFGDPVLDPPPFYRFEGTDETALADIPGAEEIMFDVVIEHRQTESKNADDGEFVPTTYASVKWLNPLGGSAKMPDPISRKDVLAKYGSKFKALSGGKAKPATTTAAAGKPAAAATKSAAGPSAKPPAKSAPGKRAADDPLAPTATLEEAWGSLIKKTESMDEEQTGAVWYAEIEKMFPGKTADQLGIREFRKLKEFIESDEFQPEQ